MYAVIEVNGVQWKVSKDSRIRVPKIEKEPGKSIDIDRILLLVDKDQINVGKPVVSNARVKATVLSHGKAEKIKVFKKKRRKDYKVLKGHRQQYTELHIDKISIETGKNKASGAGEAVAKKAVATSSAEKVKSKEAENKKANKESKKASGSGKKGEK